MNREKLQKLLSEYISILPETYSDKHEEYFKWVAVQQFQKYWDIDTTDFADMFKQAVSKTKVLINNRIMQPTAGIIKLAEQAELTETIRNMFGMLFTDDNGDLLDRQYRIEKFVLEANELLGEYEPGKWKYKQDFRSALAYLNLYCPAQNYLLKSERAHQFQYCVEYGDDFGSGSQFSLEKFYRMCDEIRQAIVSHPDLKKQHAEYLQNCPAHITDAGTIGDNDHLLTFDVIYCTSVYELYRKTGISVPRSAKERKVIEKQEREQVLRNAIQDAETKLCDLYGQRGQFEGFSLIGLQVSHSMFGSGMIIAQNQGQITVRFSDKERIMILPTAFTNHNLRTDDPQIPVIMQEIYQLDRQIENVKREIKDNQKRLQS